MRHRVPRHVTDGGPALLALFWAKKLSGQYNSGRRDILIQLATAGEDDFHYMSFDDLAKNTGIQRARVRVITRALSRVGLTQFSTGLFHPDGTVAGSGYAVTKLGHTVAQILTEGNDE